MWQPPVATAPGDTAGRRVRVAVAAGRLAGWLSRRSGHGSGSVIVGRLALAMEPGALAWLARRRTVVLVTGTNGKTTTSHLAAAALSVRGAVAHNASGSNMPDGAVAALAQRPRARWAVLEVDELHLGEVARAVVPALIVVLNLTRDQLDRGSEVRATAAAIRQVLASLPSTVVVANADDPLAVWAAAPAVRPVWVAAGGAWRADAASCPHCGAPLDERRSGDAAGVEAAAPGTGQHDDREPAWACRECGLARPRPHWWWEAGAGDLPRAHHWGGGPALEPVPIRVALPGRFNVSNAVMAVAAATAVGVDPVEAAQALSAVHEVAGRYVVTKIGPHRVRLLLMKNPAGWMEALDVLHPTRSILIVINAREADGRDVSWLWDLAMSQVVGRAVAVAGDRFADLGVRLSYAGIDHLAAHDPLDALAGLPPGEVDVVANYSAFLEMGTRLRQRATRGARSAREHRGRAP